MPTRFDRERRHFRAAEDVHRFTRPHAGGVQVESPGEMRFRKGYIDSREWPAPESAADTKINPAYVRRRFRVHRSSRG
jgi:hypothetical protein